MPQLTTARLMNIVALAKQEHPYEVPGISTRTITDGNPDYLAWTKVDCQVHLDGQGAIELVSSWGRPAAFGPGVSV